MFEQVGAGDALAAENDHGNALCRRDIAERVAVDEEEIGFQTGPEEPDSIGGAEGGGGAAGGVARF